jgi:hypothetical protein
VVDVTLPVVAVILVCAAAGYFLVLEAATLFEVALLVMLVVYVRELVRYHHN